MTNDSDLSKWITTAEASEMTGYHAVHVRRLLREGTIEGRRFGRAWMIDRESLKEYADQMKRLGSARHDPRGAAVRLAEESA